MQILSLMPADLFDSRLLAGLAIALVAGLMRGFAGFGSAMAMSPVLALLYGPAEMVVLITLMDFIVGAQLAPGAVRHAQWRFVLPMGLAAGLAMPFGAFILLGVDPALLTTALALIVLCFVGLLLTGWRYQGVKRLPITIGLGLVSGVMMAATSMGGPPVLVYMLMGQDKAVTNRANIIIYFAITEIFLIAVLLWNDLIGLDSVWRAGFLFLPFLVGSIIGQRLFRQSNELLYRRIALAFLAAVALFTLLR